VASSSVVSIAERLKQRREELGISQSQAARELDVARTAYRLWEMEAARPAPDRWRLIASWLGVSVTTMLLAEELMSDDEAQMAEVTQLAAFARTGVDWDTAAAEKPGDFFEQARSLIADGTQSGDLTSEQAEAFAFLIQRIEQERTEMETNAWEEVELRRSYPATELAPRAARDAVAVVVADLPDAEIATGRLLVSELVSNSVRHGHRMQVPRSASPWGSSAIDSESRCRMHRQAVRNSDRRAKTGVTDCVLSTPFRAAGARAEMAIST